jgi:hypothetical protein
MREFLRTGWVEPGKELVIREEGQNQIRLARIVNNICLALLSKTFTSSYCPILLFLIVTSEEFGLQCHLG